MEYFDLLSNEQQQMYLNRRELYDIVLPILVKIYNFDIISLRNPNNIDIVFYKSTQVIDIF